MFLFCGLSSHFDLYGRDGDAGDGGIKFFGKEKAAGTEAAADVEDIRFWSDVCEFGEMFDELKLRLFLGFITANPIAVMEVLAPDGTVERPKDVVVLDDFLFVVRTRRRERLIP